LTEKRSVSTNLRKWVSIMFSAGIFLLIVGLIGMILTPVSQAGQFAAAFISAGTVLIIIAGLRLYRGEKTYQQDERTKKIGAYGLSWSWFLTFITLFVVFWINYLELAFFDVGTLAVFLILLMGISAKAFQWWFFRKGDVE
jgi:hypothetical protein